MDIGALTSLGLALALGLLVGLERGWQRRGAPEGTRVLGLRTFGIIGLLGGLASLLAQAVGVWLLAAACVGLAVLLARGYAASARRDLGLTTEMAALATFALGAAAVGGYERESAAAAVTMTALLGFKPTLHRGLERLGRVELFAALQFLLISVVVLPFLPDRGYGPAAALNPYHLWLMVVLVAGISFGGYAAVKLLGPKAGIAAASLLGGFVSSTAVALALSRRGRLQPAAWRLHAGGIVLASSVMFPRVLVEVAAVDPALLRLLALPLAVMAAVGLSGAGLLVWRSKSRGTADLPEFRNPLQLPMAVFFGASLAAVTLAAVGLRRWLGDGGVYAAAAVAGVMDVDSVTLSLARLTRGDLDPGVGAKGILVAVAVNTVSKSLIAAAIARGPAAWSCAGVLGAALAAGAAAFALG